MLNRSIITLQCDQRCSCCRLITASTKPPCLLCPPAVSIQIRPAHLRFPRGNCTRLALGSSLARAEYQGRSYHHDVQAANAHRRRAKTQCSAHPGGGFGWVEDGRWVVYEVCSIVLLGCVCATYRYEDHLSSRPER